MRILLIGVVLMGLIGCKSGEPLTTVAEVDLNKYAGQWYEIERFPNTFEKNLECVTANYTVLENGKVKVVNRGHKMDDRSKVKTANGKAKVPNTNEPGKLKVTFFWPFYGDYQIMALGANYEYALVGSPNRNFLWILARDNQLPEAVLSELREEAARQGFDTSRLMKVDQSCQ